MDRLSSVHVDRAAGALVGLATGDALGAGYEFGTPPSGDAKMRGGGLGAWEPGEWTDDTQMAICIAEVTARGAVDATAIGQGFLDWFASHPKDVGNQTRSVLSNASGPRDLARAAADHFERNPRGAAGNGSLMRTAPIALAHLGDDDAIAASAREVSLLTHGDPLAAEACVLWCIAIDRAVRGGRLDGIEDGLDLLEPERRDFWSERIDEATTRPPSSFTPNGFVVTALQAACAAVAQTPVPTDDHPCLHLQHALHAAVRIGDDTDTVAAIAGSLLGARWGGSAIPSRWRRLLHGWPGYRARDLVRLAVLTARGGTSDAEGWPGDAKVRYPPMRPFRMPLPDDPGLVLGHVAGVGDPGTDAVVSLCRVGRDEVPSGIEHDEVFLVDTDDPEQNPNLDFVLDDTVESLRSLRAEGRTVYLHCVQAHRRTPAVAALYLARERGISADAAWRRLRAVLPGIQRNSAFAAALDRLAPRD